MARVYSVRPGLSRRDGNITSKGKHDVAVKRVKGPLRRQTVLCTVSDQLPDALVLADARPPALLARAPAAVILEYALSLHVFLRRLCVEADTQPPHSLQLDLRQPCSHRLIRRIPCTAS